MDKTKNRCWKKGQVVMSANQVTALELLIHCCNEQECIQPNESPPVSAEQECIQPSESPPVSAEQEYIQLDESANKQNHSSLRKRLIQFEEAMNILSWGCFWAEIGMACFYFTTGGYAKAVAALSSAISIARTIISEFRKK